MTDKQEQDVELGGADCQEQEPSCRKVHTLMLKRPSHRAALSGSDDFVYDESHYFELDEGENWLRLSQTESRHSILDDTQDFSQDSNNWFASILSLSSVGEPVNVSNNCYLCLDVDGTLMAIKDMRSPSKNDDYPPLGLARGNKREWEHLPRRQLRILQPGDRICTAYEQGSPNGLIMEYQYRPLSTARLLDSQRNALDLLTQPMDDDDDEDEEETQTEPTPTGNVQIVETQNYDSDSTAEMTQSQVALGGQPSLGLSTQPNDDDDDASDSAKNLNNLHPDGPEPPSTPCGTVVVQKKQSHKNIPSPIAEADEEGESQEDITQEPALTTSTPIPSEQLVQGQDNERDDLLYSVTPKSNHEKMNVEPLDPHKAGKKDPSHESCPNDVSTDLELQNHDPAPAKSLPTLPPTESNSVDEVSEQQQQNCHGSMDQENLEEPTKTPQPSSQIESPVEEECVDQTELSHQQEARLSTDNKDMLAKSENQNNPDDTPSNANQGSEADTGATVPNNFCLDQSVEGHNNAAPSHDATPSQDISMSMLRETGEETPLEGLDVMNNDDSDSDVTDVEILNRADQINHTPNTTKQNQSLNLANNDNDSEITEVDDVVPRKDPQESVNIVQFPPATKYDDDSEITEVDVDPIRQKTEDVTDLAPTVPQPDNISNNHDGNRISHVDNDIGTGDPKQSTDNSEGPAIQLSKGNEDVCHEDGTSVAIPTTIAHKTEESQGPRVDGTDDKIGVPDGIEDVVVATTHLTSDTNKENIPKLCLEVTASNAAISVEKPEEEQAIPTTIAQTTEDIQGDVVHAAGDQNEVADEIQDDRKADRDLSPYTDKIEAPKPCLEVTALDADLSVDKAEDAQAHGKQPSKPEETVNDENVAESTHLGSKSDCHETANARVIRDEKSKDSVTAPLVTDEGKKKSDDGVKDEQENLQENPSPCQTEGMVRVDGEVSEMDIRFDAEDPSNDHDVNAANIVADHSFSKSHVTQEDATATVDDGNEGKAIRDGETSEVGQDGPPVPDMPRKSKRKLRAEAYERAVEGMTHDKLQVQATHTKRRKQSGLLVGADVLPTKSSTGVTDATPQQSLVEECTDETPLQPEKRRRSSKRHGVLNDVSSPYAPASISSSTSSATWSTRKRARGTPPAWNLDENPPIRVMATNVEIDNKGKQMIKKIGGIFIDKIDDAFKATHVIAASKDVKLKRTPKFMVAISRTSNIVHLDWLIESARKGEALEAQEFLLLDQTEAEMQYNFKLRDTLARGNKLRDKGTWLLDGIEVYLCHGVAGSVRQGDKTPPEHDFRLILEAAGAKVLTSLPTQRCSGQMKTVIITSKDTKERKKQLSKRDVMTAIKQGAVAKTTEEIFHAIMRQDFKI